MIPAQNIVAWGNVVPWADQRQVEQDLIISRALVEIFSDDMLRDALRFRGGTALNKLHFPEPLRYSEDIDLVRTSAGPIGPILDQLRVVLEPWLGRAQFDQSPVAPKFRFRAEAEDGSGVPIRLKIEINTRETEAFDASTALPLEVVNPWFSGEAAIPTFSREEMLATKLRALLQRDKGRDLYDLAHALEVFEHLDVDRVVEMLGRYLDLAGQAITRAQAQERMFAKLANPRFLLDMRPLLPATQVEAWTQESTDEAFRRVFTILVDRLERMRLARETAPGLWRLADDLGARLRRMGERGDIIKTLHAAMRAHGHDRGGAELAIYDPSDADAKPLVGQVVEIGLSDELRDRQYLIIDGTDGRAHYADIGEGQNLADIRQGTIVSLHPRSTEPLGVDHAISEIAERHGGRYGIAIHREAERGISEDYARSHVRRLEFLRRAGHVERLPDGQWCIPDDYLDRAARVERDQARRRPVELEARSFLSLDRQVRSDGATWLDRQLVGAEAKPVRSSGFGREVERALEARRSYLIERGHAEERGTRTVYRRNLLALLRAQELQRVGGELAERTGLAFHETRDREPVEGTYRRAVHLASGKFAVIERAQQFTLVPWRPVLERARDKKVSGMLRGQSISWAIGRGRGPEIS